MLIHTVNAITDRAIFRELGLKELSKHNKDQFSYHNQLTRRANKELEQVIDAKKIMSPPWNRWLDHIINDVTSCRRALTFLARAAS